MFYCLGLDFHFAVLYKHAEFALPHWAPGHSREQLVCVVTLQKFLNKGQHCIHRLLHALDTFVTIIEASLP